VACVVVPVSLHAVCFENTDTGSAPRTHLHLRVSTLPPQLERVERLGEEAWAGVAAVDRGEDNASAGLACVPSAEIGLEQDKGVSDCRRAYPHTPYGIGGDSAVMLFYLTYE